MRVFEARVLPFAMPTKAGSVVLPNTRVNFRLEWLKSRNDKTRDATSPSSAFAHLLPPVLSRTLCTQHPEHFALGGFWRCSTIFLPAACVETGAAVASALRSWQLSKLRHIRASADSVDDAKGRQDPLRRLPRTAAPDSIPPPPFPNVAWRWSAQRLPCYCTRRHQLPRVLCKLSVRTNSIHIGRKHPVGASYLYGVKQNSLNS